MKRAVRFVAVAVATAVATVPAGVSAFCGFYVSGADASLYSDATMVALMREGTRTVLSMQNNYQGPPEDFAMVVPVPVVLQEENVETLPKEVFQRLDQLAAPRLVEYWEEDPCRPPPRPRMMRSMAAPGAVAEESAADGDLGVRIEAQFQVAEYDVVILSARDSSGLDTWLRQNDYNIPQGAGDVLGPYVQQGTKFFVAKVDVERVQFVNGRAVLSPLRVHYDTPEFWLPVRLGLLNSKGQQDLIVHVLGRGTRYEVANYENATIPTNIRMNDAVRDEFGAVYEQLFARTIARNPRTVVTEYSWDASTCDPCPTEPLTPAELLTLGANVLPDQPTHGFVLTRLHYRYSPEDLGEDLVFRAATPIDGGRGTPDAEGNLQQGARPGRINQFQGRYVILHPWEGAVACDNPVHGQWGGPPNGRPPQPIPAASQLTRTSAAVDSAPAQLGVMVAQDVPEIGVVQGETTASAGSGGAATGGSAGAASGGSPGPTAPPPQTRQDGGCASCTVGGGKAPLAATFLLVVVSALWLRRRTPRR